jgi:hypothetical protein
MWPFPKKLFQWTEPRAFRQTLSKVEAQKAGWWDKPAAVLLFAALVLPLWLLAKWNPNNNPPPFWAALLVALAFGLLLGYVFPWMLSLCPTYIMVFENRICRVVGNTSQACKLPDITAYSWRDCDEYDLLVLEHREGQILIGVPRRVSRAELEGYFAARGLEKLHVSSGTESPLSVLSTAASSKT